MIVNSGFSPCFTKQSKPILDSFGDQTKYPLQAFNAVIYDEHSGLLSVNVDFLIIFARSYIKT